MIKQVMLLGATGNFGRKIALALAKESIPLVLVARDRNKLINLKQDIEIQHNALSLVTAAFDIKDIEHQLTLLKPFIVINTCGPFKAEDYSVALACIRQGIHYIDLADNRKFVNDFHGKLNNLAIENECLAVTGASTVPCLSSAVLEKYKHEFDHIDSLIYGITPGQKTERGLATVQSILSYVGKPLVPFNGTKSNVYGWQNLYRQRYPDLGKRWMANCDIPDLDLLPSHYHLKSIRFSAGIENSFLHLSLWALSWLARLRIPISLEAYAKPLVNMSHLFDGLGSADGGMHLIMSGRDKCGNQKTITWFLIAKNGDGPYIPSAPAVILTKKLLKDTMSRIGAMPCVALISLEEYLAELHERNIYVYVEED